MINKMANDHYNHYKAVLEQCNRDKCAAYAALQKELDELNPTEEEVTDYFFLETCVDYAGHEVIHEHMPENGYKYSIDNHAYIKEG